jgi:hypothetical protein
VPAAAQVPCPVSPQVVAALMLREGKNKTVVELSGSPQGTIALRSRAEFNLGESVALVKHKYARKSRDQGTREAAGVVNDAQNKRQRAGLARQMHNEQDAFLEGDAVHEEGSEFNPFVMFDDDVAENAGIAVGSAGLTL